MLINFRCLLKRKRIQPEHKYSWWCDKKELMLATKGKGKKLIHEILAK